MTDRVRISALRKTGDHQARIAILSGLNLLEHPNKDK